jgi:hypothetical protein
MRPLSYEVKLGDYLFPEVIITCIALPTTASDLIFRVRFEVFAVVTMKNCVFWDVTPCGSCKNRRFGGTSRLLHQGDKNR